MDHLIIDDLAIKRLIFHSFFVCLPESNLKYTPIWIHLAPIIAPSTVSRPLSPPQKPLSSGPRTKLL